MDNLLYRFFYIISLLPFGFLYLIADMIAWLAGDIIRYRRRVVYDNIRSSFPQMSEKEVKKTVRDFYHFLADYFVETIKLLSISPEEMKQRMIIENPELPNEILKQNRSIVLYLGHYCNWEWVSSLPLSLPSDVEAAQIYHPLENATFDRFFYKLRTRFGARNVAMDDTLRTLLGWKRDGITSITGFIADQAPGMNIHLFLDFLNHDTGVYTGPERIARKLNAAVLYADISRPRRGYYNLKFLSICDQAKEMPTFEITRKYFSLLQDTILRQPAFWLWSHRRWKRSRELFLQVHGEKATEMLSHL